MKHILNIIFLLFFSHLVCAQQDYLELDTYGNETSFRALKNITLQSGFHIPVGKNVSLSIQQYPDVNSTPSNIRNYRLTRTFRVPVKSEQLPQVRTIEEENQTVEYFDGLGRPIQIVELMASPRYKDIVQYIEYDNFGRESTKYLPYAEEISADGAFKSSAKVGQRNYYDAAVGWDESVVKTPYPSSATVFENSPLSRVLEQGTPGAVWQPEQSAVSGSGHTRKILYGVNTSDEVYNWHSVPGLRIIGSGNLIGAGKLFKRTIREENWNGGKTGTIEEFTDQRGRTVLRRFWESELKCASTYYVFDNLDNLLYVLPPEITETGEQGESFYYETNSLFHDYIYAYRYDLRNRLVERKVPGKGWEYIVYNDSDQPILVQDEVQRLENKWIYTKYDAFGRITETGIHIGEYGNQKEAQNIADSVNRSADSYWEERIGVNSYTNQSFPLTGNTPLVTNYYDDYSFLQAGNESLQPIDIIATKLTDGLLTGTLIRKDDGSGPLLTINYFDSQARLIQSASQNHVGGTDYLTNTYSFYGELLTSKRQHRPSLVGTTTTILTVNDYDHIGRLMETRKKINDQTEIVQSRLAYNEVGQLKEKELHSEDGGANFLTSQIYSYNERGWLTSMVSPHFSYRLDYNCDENGVVLSNPQYNGNISRNHWGYGASTSSMFNYTYDNLNRLTSGTSIGTVMSEVLAYDDMGNITNLKRDGHATGINYTYTGNRLTSLSGALTGSYTYDANGNATKDRTGMTFSYNHLNLPKTATKSGASVTYLYDALGTKLRKTATVGSTTMQRDYVGGIEYSKLGTGASSIEMIHTEEGYLQRNAGNNTYTYHYNLTDHLGNVRATLQRTGPTTGNVVQKHDYYPFGKAKAIVTSGINKYLYNGKELQSEIGGQYDYGARFYDAEIGRWNVVDPLADQFENVSPYNYAMNNPILMIDPDGMAADTIRMQEIFVNAPKREPVSGFWGNVYHIWSGGHHDGFQYDRQGNPLGFSPIMGMPPDFSFATKPLKILELAKDVRSLLKIGKETVKTAGNIAKNAKKMSPDDIGKFLGAGKDWHKTSAKTKFLKQFKKELKGDTNADFYIDKTTKEVFLKSNKSNNWINTGQKFE